MTDEPSGPGLPWPARTYWIVTRPDGTINEDASVVLASNSTTHIFVADQSPAEYGVAAMPGFSIFDARPQRFTGGGKAALFSCVWKPPFDMVADDSVPTSVRARAVP